MQEQLQSEWKWNPLKRAASDKLELNYNKISRVESEQVFKEKSIKCWYSPNCSLLAPFSTFKEYEEHYNKYHENICSQCHNILPTRHLLHLHLLECHDSFFAVKSVGSKSFECFVETCKKKFKYSKDRIRHLINLHKFPCNFQFGVVNGTKLRIKQEREFEREKDQIDADLTTSFAKLTIPRSVQLLNNKFVNSQEKDKKDNS
jgi:hypothetical protein